MEIVIGVVGLCGMAVVALILWDRLGRLEFEINRLKAMVQESPAQIAQVPAVEIAVADAAVAPSAIQSSLAIDPSETRSEPAPPAIVVTPTEHSSDLMPVAAMARTGADDTSRPANTERKSADRRPPAPSAPRPPQPDRAARRRGFEQLFGARLAVWGGGIALAMAGFFLVKYSVEIGLITPPVRMVLGGLFGLILLAAAEFVHRRPAIANGVRIAQSLAGAGIVVLYAVIYITTSIHALVPTAIGFLGLAATTAAALLLSLRRGPPIAVMGLIGGFATPALVSTDSPNVPVLMLYLFLVIGGLMLLIRRQGWWWLAIPAALGGFGWIGLLLANGLAAENSVWIGLFLLAMTGMVFATSAEDRKVPLGQVLRGARSLMPILTGGVALAQLAIVVGASGFGWTDWGLFGLLAAACVILGARNANCALLPPIALTVAVTLLALWTGPDPFRFIVMATVFLVLFAGAGYWLTWKSEQPLLWLGQALAASAGLYAASYVTLRPEPIGFTSDAAWAALAIILAIPATLAAAKARAMRGTLGLAADRLILTAGAVSAAFVTVALLLTVPATQLPLALALQTLAMVFVARRFDIDVLNWLVPPLGGAFAVAFLAVPGAPYADALSRLLLDFAQPGAAIGIGQTLWVLVLPSATAAAAVLVSRWASHRLVFSWTSMALATLAVAALVPPAWLPLAMTLEALALVLLGLRYGRRDLIDQSIAAIGLFGVQILPILADILLVTAPSLVGQPIEAGQLPGLGHALRVLMLPAVSLAAVAWLYPADRRRIWRLVLAGGAATAVLLLGYFAVKALFGIDTLKEFQQRGFFERALLTQALFALGAVAFWARDRIKLEALVWPGMILTGMAVARLVWFDLLVFNPMLAAQHVGDWPLLNGLLLTYGLPILWLVVLQRVTMPLPALRHHVVAAKAACLALILILALLQLRQLFHGGLIIAGAVGTAELYAYSAAALATAIGFLLWGTARGDQMTRLASLGLMLAAIAKVFLYDASELTGLWRIAAFAGLGVSLLGISWFYGRYVFADRRDSAERPVMDEGPEPETVAEA